MSPGQEGRERERGRERGRGGKEGGVFTRIYPLCEIFYFLWHRHWVEGTYSF